MCDSLVAEGGEGLIGVVFADTHLVEVHGSRAEVAHLDLSENIKR